MIFSKTGTHFSGSCLGSRHDLLARNAAFRCDLALERQAGVDAGTVGIDVYERTIAELAQRQVLQLEHVIVLAEGDVDGGEQSLGRLRLVLAIAIRRRPEEPAR